MNGSDETIKHVADAASILTVIGTLTNVLPHAAALFTIIWTSIRIYETDTVQRLLGKKQG
jgi:hypothetical protein